MKAQRWRLRPEYSEIPGMALDNFTIDPSPTEHEHISRWHDLTRAGQESTVLVAAGRADNSIVARRGKGTGTSLTKSAPKPRDDPGGESEKRSAGAARPSIVTCCLVPPDRGAGAYARPLPAR